MLRLQTAVAKSEPRIDGVAYLTLSRLEESTAEKPDKGRYSYWACIKRIRAILQKMKQKTTIFKQHHNHPILQHSVLDFRLSAIA